MKLKKKMDWRKENYSKLDDNVAQNILKSLITYPRTESLEKDKPFVNLKIEVPSKEAYQNIIESLKMNVQLKAVDGREDIIYILGHLSFLREELLLDQCDYIQIYKGGMNLLRIQIGENNNGRSAYIEIHSLCLKLMNCLQGKSFSESIPDIKIIIIFGLTAITSFLLGSKYFQTNHEKN